MFVSLVGRVTVKTVSLVKRMVHRSSSRRIQWRTTTPLTHRHRHRRTTTVWPMRPQRRRNRRPTRMRSQSDAGLASFYQTSKDF
jgi:hypothetical protein